MTHPKQSPSNVHQLLQQEKWGPQCQYVLCQVVQQLVYCLFQMEAETSFPQYMLHSRLDNWSRDIGMYQVPRPGPHWLGAASMFHLDVPFCYARGIVWHSCVSFGWGFWTSQQLKFFCG
eukprot:jgi/Botrbrau1/10442/Bobra.0133s0049.1